MTGEMSTPVETKPRLVKNGMANADVVVDGVVYVGSDDQHVYALNASTGAVVWSHPTNSFITSVSIRLLGVLWRTQQHQIDSETTRRDKVTYHLVSGHLSRGDF